MAKFEKYITGDFYNTLSRLENHILNGSTSASLEDRSDVTCGNVLCSVRVFERYSYFGGNRVSLNVTLVGNGNNLFISAITSGGSQAVFFKINTIGENSFLSCVEEFFENM